MVSHLCYICHTSGVYSRSIRDPLVRTAKRQKRCDGLGVADPSLGLVWPYLDPLVPAINTERLLSRLLLDGFFGRVRIFSHSMHTSKHADQLNCFGT